MIDNFIEYMWYLLTTPLKKLKKSLNKWYILCRVYGRRFDEVKEDILRARDEGMVATCCHEMLPVHGADRVPCLSPLERRRIYILSVSAGLLGGGAGLAGEPRPAPVLYRLPADSAGVSRFADCGYCTWVSAEKTAECGYTRREYLETMEEHCIRSHDSCFADWLRYNR